MVVERLCLLELSKHIHVSKRLTLVSLLVAGGLRLLRNRLHVLRNRTV